MQIEIDQTTSNDAIAQVGAAAAIARAMLRLYSINELDTLDEAILTQYLGHASQVERRRLVTAMCPKGSLPPEGVYNTRNRKALVG